MMVFKYDISDIAAQDMECFRDMTAYVSSYIISIDKTENGEMYFNITDGHADEVRRKLDILKRYFSQQLITKRLTMRQYMKNCLGERI